MFSQDPFGRPPGNDPFGRPPGGPIPPYQQGGRRRRSGLRAAAWAGFIAFDVVIVLVVGALFFTGVIGGDDSDTVIIPPSGQNGEVATPVDADDLAEDADDDDDDTKTTVVTKESGTSTIVTPDDDAGDPATAGPAPAGINASSMIRESNFRPALADLKKLAPGKVLMLSIHPTHVSATVKAANGDMKIVVDHWDRPAQLLNTVDGAAAHRNDTVSWSSINPAAPERLVKASGASNGQVSHLVVMPVFDPWALHLKSGKRIPADSKGRPKG